MDDKTSIYHTSLAIAYNGVFHMIVMFSSLTLLRSLGWKFGAVAFHNSKRVTIKTNDGFNDTEFEEVNNFEYLRVWMKSTGKVLSLFDNFEMFIVKLCFVLVVSHVMAKSIHVSQICQCVKWSTKNSSI